MRTLCASNAQWSSEECADYAHDFAVRAMHKAPMDTEWFKDRKKEHKVTDLALAQALCVERSVANKIVNGKVEFNARRADAVAKLLHVSRDEVLFRAGISQKPPDVTEKAADLPVARSVDGGETVEIIQLDLSLPMGSGATVDDYIEEEPRLFDLAYIRSFTRTEPTRLRLARGVGDSMWPTLQSYDQVWIDSTQRELNQNDRIWAVSINGGAAIKRLRRVKGGRVLIMSDNPGPGHDAYEVGEDEILIGGRVIRFARDI
jgi:transcriptional regulator with XRE-family HTH domain